MTLIKQTALAFLLVAFAQCTPALAAEGVQEKGLQVQVPVPLKESKVVFNMDHLAFVGDQPIGLSYMKLMVQHYKGEKVPLQLIAVFHGPAGYMVLNDAAYDKVRKSERGNPFKDQIKALQDEGVQFELCVYTAKNNGWENADILPGVKVNAGGNVRIVELVQDGYVQIQP